MRHEELTGVQCRPVRRDGEVEDGIETFGNNVNSREEIARCEGLQATL
jgi:hypothetical protein